MKLPDLTSLVLPSWAGPAFRIALCVGLFIGGYVYRGDCAREVRATEQVSTAHAEVTAAHIETKAEVKHVQQQQRRDRITAAIDDLPPAPVVAPAVSPSAAPVCPARELSDAELRLWNAGNEDDDHGVQQADVDRPLPGEAAPAGKP